MFGYLSLRLCYIPFITFYINYIYRNYSCMFPLQLAYLIRYNSIGELCVPVGYMSISINSSQYMELRVGVVIAFAI